MESVKLNNGNSEAIASRSTTHCSGEHVCPSSKHHPHMPNFTPLACVEWRKENVDRTGTEIVVSALMAGPIRCQCYRASPYRSERSQKHKRRERREEDIERAIFVEGNHPSRLLDRGDARRIRAVV